jgi:hypothetical protein
VNAEEGQRAITAIKRIENHTNERIYAVNIEKNHQNYYIGSKKADGSPGTVNVDWWVPWCANAGDFSGGKHIEIHATDRPVPNFNFNIWQRDVNWDDRVRWTNEYGWDEYARPMPGDSGVHGDRYLRIFAFEGPATEDNDRRAKLVMADAPVPSTINPVDVSFFPPSPNQPFDFVAFGLPPLAPTGSRIDRVTNTAVSAVNPQVKIPLTLSFQDKEGRRAGPVDLEPNQTVSGDFRGLLTDGRWTARARNISALYLGSRGFLCELFWTR